MLTTQDLATLERSFIHPELAQQARLFRVTSDEGACLVGRNGGGDYAGIAFPYIWPGETTVREYRLRRDRPDLERQPDGAHKEKAKYLSPPGRASMLYFVPGTHSEWLHDSNLPIVFTEGEKKTIALYHLSFHKSETARFLAVGIPGVWNWRGTVGKAQDEHGARRDEKGPIPDLSRITWKNRMVHVLFDANVATNSEVRTARSHLAIELAGRGAIVRLVDLPQIKNVNGVDDLLGLKGPDYVLALIETAKPYAEEKPTRKPQATVLIELADDAELFHTPEQDAYATIRVGEHLETWPLKARGFKDWLMRRFYQAEGSTPSAQAVQDAVDTLRGRARFDGPTREVDTRVAEHEGTIYIDLCDEQWRIVRVTHKGWQVIDNPPVKFRRAKGMLPLPEPTLGGTVDSLRDFVNVTADDWPLILSWLIATFRPGRPFPVLALHGEQGSAKSTTARVLRSLIDPNKADLRSEQREERDLMIAAKNGWLIVLDNLSRLPAWLSDALCRLATGGGFATRELYANDEEVIFDAKRPILLNGIEELATRSDLLERSIVLNLPAIPEEKRRTEAEFWTEFEAARPSILGALLDAVSGALCQQGGVRLARLPRMADFAQWAAAAETSLGLSAGAFMEAYTGNRTVSNDLALEASPVAAAALSFVEAEERWQGTPSELLQELNRRTAENLQRQQGWPKAANSLSGILKRLAPNLRAAGVNVSRPNRSGKKGTRLILLERAGIQPSEASEVSDPPESSADYAHSSDDIPDGSHSSDDPASSQCHNSMEENACEIAPSGDTDGSDGLSRECSSKMLDYEPDEEELRYEAEERAAIIAESETVQAEHVRTGGYG